MAIVKYGSGQGVVDPERRTGIKAAKKAAKHPAKKHAAKHDMKHAAKHVEKRVSQQPEKPPQDKASENLAKAFHHLQRAGSVISLLGQESGGDLRTLYELGIDQYRKAAGLKAKKHEARAAQGILRATEHLALAGLYSARMSHLVQVAVPETSGSRKELSKLATRLERLDFAGEGAAGQVEAAARELLRRAGNASKDMHLEHELTKAVDGLCTALEEGM